jgi:hypothetical protein
MRLHQIQVSLTSFNSVTTKNIDQRLKIFPKYLFMVLQKEARDEWSRAYHHIQRNECCLAFYVLFLGPKNMKRVAKPSLLPK